MSTNKGGAAVRSFAPAPDLGDRFGRWTVVGFTNHHKWRYLFCEVICDCGAKGSIRPRKLRAGSSLSCGCRRHEMDVEAANRRIFVGPGARFGLLTVVESRPTRSRRTRWWAKCDCGSFKEVRTDALREGKTTSCGCASYESQKKRLTIHGGSRAPEYHAWKGARARCQDPDNENFPHYGGRGIRFDPLWQDFNVFLTDVGPRPSKGHTLDRIDVNGDYTNGNCRWATHKEQAANKRKRLRIEQYSTDELLAELRRRGCSDASDGGLHALTLAA